MPQDNVEPCRYCGGTGEVRFQWWVEQRYQDCTEWAGPFETQEEAQREARELDDGNGNPSCRVVKQYDKTREGV